MAATRLPAYSRHLPPEARPVLVTSEWPLAREIDRRGGICLVCDQDPAGYRFDEIQGRELWVLWLADEPAGRALARRVAMVASEGYLIRAGGLYGC